MFASDYSLTKFNTFRKMEDQLMIVLDAFGYLSKEDNSWETSGLSLVEFNGGMYFHLCDDEIRIICDSLAEITPLKNERWHKLTLKRVYIEGGYQVPSECFYEKISIELMPNICLSCGKQIPKEDSDLIDVYGVDPYCSQWCSEIGNGTPMPVSQGALTFDKIFNQPENGFSAF